MTTLTICYLSCVAAAVLAPLIIRSRWRAVTTGTLTVVFCVFGAALGVGALTGLRGTLTVAAAVGAPLTFATDRLGGLFMLIVSIVGALASAFAAGRSSGIAGAGWVAWPVFFAGMQLVPAAADVVSFVLVWEVMTLASVVLVASAHRTNGPVSAATIWYAAMSQLSFFLILAGFAVLSAIAGSTSFARIAAISPNAVTTGIAVVLLVAGLAGKSELVPWHVWVPRVLPEVPAPVAAGMSGAMVNIGVYGVLLVTVRLLPGGPEWWGILLMVLGGVSAVYGILQASVNSGLKTLLAYSTTENMGLVFLAVGASVLLHAIHADPAADAALLAAGLLTVSHALFKTTLFLGAGAIESSAGSTNLDQLGGLLKRMPWTAATFGTAALAAAALPVTSGFVAEWTLLQALVHGSRPSSGQVAVQVAMPLAVAVVALTAGLALMTFVKAYGIAFLARSRSTAAGVAVEAPWRARLPLLAGAVLIFVVGVFPGWVAALLTPALSAAGIRQAGWGGLNIPSIGVQLEPAGLVVTAAAGLLPIMAAVWLVSRRHRTRRTELPWGGGGSRARPRMQYTATSYAEPLVRVFDDVLKPSRDVQVTHIGESRYLVERVLVEQRLTDVVESRLYRPVLTRIDRFGKAARHAQNGSIHRYLTYSFAALLVVLVVVAI